MPLLAFFLLQFLPYHHEWVTWWQRLLVVADLTLLWILWPSVARGQILRINWRRFIRVKTLSALLASLVPVLLIFGIGTFPGEWLDSKLPSLRIIPIHWNSPDGSPVEWTSLHTLLVAGDLDRVTRRPRSLWSNRLVVPGIDVIDRAKFDTESKIAALRETVSFRGRHLEGAIFSDARLTKADFTAAHLQGADLSRADLVGAKFGCETGARVGVRVPEHCTDLEDARLDRAQLQGASLVGVNLRGARLYDAQLQGASLIGADLRGANLYSANLQSAALSGQLQGASLIHVKLQGAWMEGANLQGAALNHAQLQGARLDNANLQGAVLDYAQLQGASLVEANLENTTMEYGFVWRADIRKASTKEARITEPETGAKFFCTNKKDSCDWSASEFTTWKQTTDEAARKSAYRESSNAVLVLDPSHPLDQDKEIARAWTDLASSSSSQEEHEKRLAIQLRETGCSAKDTAHVIKGIISHFEVENKNPLVASLAETFLDEAHCSASKFLSDKDRASLQETLKSAR